MYNQEESLDNNQDILRELISSQNGDKHLIDIQERFALEPETLNRLYDRNQDRQCSMLYYAAKAGNYVICSYLLNQGADPNIGYQSPIHGAIQSDGNSEQIFDLLISHNAHVDRRSFSQPCQTPEQLAKSVGNKTIATKIAAIKLRPRDQDLKENESRPPEETPLLYHNNDTPPTSFWPRPLRTVMQLFSNQTQEQTTKYN